MKKEQMIERLAAVAAVIEQLPVDEIDQVQITWMDPCGMVKIAPEALRAVVPDVTVVRHTLSARTLSGTIDGVTVQASEFKAVPRGV